MTNEHMIMQKLWACLEMELRYTSIYLYIYKYIYIIYIHIYILYTYGLYDVMFEPWSHEV